MAILLGLMVFLLLVSAILPKTSDAVPLLSKYLLFTFLINVLVGTPRRLPQFLTPSIIHTQFHGPIRKCTK